MTKKFGEVSIKRFYGETKEASWSKNITERKRCLQIIGEKHQDLGTITESHQLNNVIFTQNSLMGILFVQRNSYGLMYDGFFKLDQKIKQNRLTMRLHQNRKRQEVINGVEAENDASTLIAEAIFDSRAFKMFDREQQVWPSQTTLEKLEMIRRYRDEIETRKNASVDTNILSAKLPLKQKDVTCFPSVLFVPDRMFSSDEAIKITKPYSETTVSLKRMKGFVCLHFHGTRNLQRVHEAIKLAEESEKPLKGRHSKGTRMPYVVGAFRKYREVKTLYAQSSVHHSFIQRACCEGFATQFQALKPLKIRGQFTLDEESFVEKFSAAAESPTVFRHLKYAYRGPQRSEPELCATRFSGDKSYSKFIQNLFKKIKRILTE